MSILLNCQNISKSFGAHRLFEGITLGFSSEERLGLIGPNGSGKSTLLKILAGQEDIDSGNIFVTRHTRLVYLAQQEDFEPEKSVEEVLVDALLSEEIEESEKHYRVQRIISLAEFEDPLQKTVELSGGWKKRLAISAALVQEPDLLLMDEPTNHLDMEGILWLEKCLASADFSYVLVSHDRYFLENCTNRIVELSRQYPDGYFRVEGNYSRFLEKREAFVQEQGRQETTLSNKVRRETEWLRRGPKARTTKAKYRIDEAHRLQDELSQVRERNRQKQNIGISFDSSGRKTKKLVETHNLGKSLGGRKLFAGVNLRLSPGSRLGLLGRNGSGKSTFMHLLKGTLSPDEGDIKKVDGLRVVYFDQNRDQLNQEEKLRRALAPAGDSVIFQGRSLHVVSWAKRFLFSPDQLEMPVSRLSGGEQARILIARLMLEPADVLLLDEPTNDLDIPALDILEESLQDFPGAIVLVTHDRFLMDRIADQILGLDGRGNAGLYADFYQFLADIKKDRQGKKDPKNTVQSKKIPGKKRKLTYKEQLELDGIEERILAAEDILEAFKRKIDQPEIMNNPELLQEYCRKLPPAQNEVDMLYRRWENLEAMKTSS